MDNTQNHTFRKLLVWQKSMALVTLIYSDVKVFLSDGLSSQIKRSATFIPSNIALSSLFELQTQLEIAYNLNFLKQDNFNQLYNNSREVERMLTSFIRKI